MMSNFKSGLFVCLSLTVIAAGGASCGTVPVPQPQITLDTAFDRTGTLRSDGLFTGMLDNNSVIAGDEGNTNLAQRGIVSVVLSTIPAGANITNVTLRLQGSAPEGNPFADFGSMQIDHVNVVSSITVLNFAGNTLTPNVLIIPSLPSGLNKQVVELDITNEVMADIAAGRPISSFRFQFNNAPSLDGTFDQVFFNANQNDIEFRPTASVTLGS